MVLYTNRQYFGLKLSWIGTCTGSGKKKNGNDRGNFHHEDKWCFKLDISFMINIPTLGNPFRCDSGLFKAKVKLFTSFMCQLYSTEKAIIKISTNLHVNIQKPEQSEPWENYENSKQL